MKTYQYKRHIRQTTRPMLKKHALLLCCLFTSCNLVAQLRMGTGTQLNSASNTTIATDANINNQSANTNLTNAHIHLLGSSQQLNTIGSLSIGNVTIDNGGDRSVNGEWIFLNGMSLIDGILTPLNSARILYTGASPINGNASSYVNGYFYSQGSGTRNFPIGLNGLFAPANVSSDATGVLGMRVVNGTPGITLPVDVTEILSSHYWEFIADDATPITASVSLSTTNLGSLDGASDLVVVQGDANTLAGTNLGGIVSGSFVSSQRGASTGLLTIGRGEKINLIIHDMITPFNTDLVNDVLTIEGIELTETNKVTLMDRYGATVKTWTDYHLQDPTTLFDFTQLTPGNYICVVEYTLLGGSQTEKISQMVTILQTN